MSTIAFPRLLPNWHAHLSPLQLQGETFILRIPRVETPGLSSGSNLLLGRIPTDNFPSMSFGLIDSLYREVRTRKFLSPG